MTRPVLSLPKGTQRALFRVPRSSLGDLPSSHPEPTPEPSTPRQRVGRARVAPSRWPATAAAMAILYGDHGDLFAMGGRS